MGRMTKEEIIEEAERLKKKHPELQVKDTSKRLTYLSEEQRMARDLYVNQGVPTHKEIAERVGVHPSTVSRWISDYGWKEERARAQRSPERIAEKLQMLLDTELDRMDTKPGGIDSSDVDKLSKIVAALQRIMPNKRMYGSILAAIEDWMEFLAIHDPDLRQRSLEYLPAFGKEIADKYDY